MVVIGVKMYIGHLMKLMLGVDDLLEFGVGEFGKGKRKFSSRRLRVFF